MRVSVEKLFVVGRKIVNLTVTSIGFKFKYLFSWYLYTVKFVRHSGNNQPSDRTHTSGTIETSAAARIRGKYNFRYSDVARILEEHRLRIFVKHPLRCRQVTTFLYALSSSDGPAMVIICNS
jgi:hypothetical protein